MIHSKEPYKKFGCEILLARQYGWYKLSKNIPIPTNIILKEDCLEMENLEGYSHPKISNENILLILSIITNLHKTKNSLIYLDLFDMYINKPIERLIKFDKISSVDSLVVHNLICNAYNQIVNPIQSAFIHGDLTFSNILEKDNDIRFIDPRPIFGLSQLYGDPRYDIAKLRYSINGYEDIRRGISTPREMVELFDSQIEKDYNLNEIKFIEATIWLSATGYFMNKEWGIQFIEKANNLFREIL